MTKREAQHFDNLAASNRSRKPRAKQRVWMWADQLWQDVAFAVACFANRPGFAIASVLTLGVGIGINVAIYSVIHAVLLSELPYESPIVLRRQFRKHGPAMFRRPRFPIIWIEKERSIPSMTSRFCDVTISI